MALILIKQTLDEILKQIAKRALIAVTAGTVGLEVGKAINKPSGELVHYNSTVEKITQRAESPVLGNISILCIIFMLILVIAVTWKLFFAKKSEVQEDIELNGMHLDV